MKKVLSLLITMSSVQFTIAQVRVINFNDSELKGPVKQVIEYLIQTTDSSKTDTTLFNEKSIKRFDRNGNEIEEVRYDHLNYLTFRLTYNYPNDTTVITNQYAPRGGLLVQSVYVFNKEGREIGLEPNINPAIRLGISKYIYKYNSKGNRVEEKGYDGSNLIIETKLIYNDRNQEISEETNDLNHGYFAKKITYNALGDKIKIEKTEFFDSHSVELYKDFDFNHNWITSAILSERYPDNYSVIYVIKRFIIYY